MCSESGPKSVIFLIVLSSFSSLNVPEGALVCLVHCWPPVNNPHLTAKHPKAAENSSNSTTMTRVAQEESVLNFSC